MTVVLLASEGDRPVLETLPVPVPVGPAVSDPYVLLAKGPLETEEGSETSAEPVVTIGTNDGADGLGQSVRVMSLPLNTVTRDELTSKAEHMPMLSQVTDITLFFGWKAGRGTGAAVILEASSLHGEP